MKYDFDTLLPRAGTCAAKYDERQKKFAADDVIPLWVADMDFATAPAVTEALRQRAAHPIYGYTSRPGSYLDAICRWQERRHRFSLKPQQLSYSPGVIPSLSAIIELFTEKGDAVLIQTPVYPEFKDAILARERRLIESRLIEEDGYYTVDWEHFESVLKAERPRLFILCSPHNPVGRVWQREELLKMGNLCLRYGVKIISDEIHGDLVLFDSQHHPTASLGPEIADNTITLLSGTKTFNLAGLQASAAVFFRPEEKEQFDRFWKSLDIVRNNCFSLVAMEAAFRGGEEWLDSLRAYLEGNIRFIAQFCAEHIPEIRIRIPESTYLVWLDCRRLEYGSEELSHFMIRKAGLGLNSGASFGPGGEGFMRLNAACPRIVLRQAMAQLKNAVDTR